MNILAFEGMFEGHLRQQWRNDSRARGSLVAQLDECFDDGLVWSANEWNIIIGSERAEPAVDGSEIGLAH